MADLTVVCAWCKKHLKGPKSGAPVSHSLCDECRRIHFPDLPKKATNPNWRLLSVKKSRKRGKKLTAEFEDRDSGRTKITHFGATGYSDFTKHRDPERQARYLARHESSEDWSDPTTPGALSRWVLWNKPTLQASVSDFKRRFALNPPDVVITTKERAFPGSKGLWRGEVKFFASIGGKQVGELFVNFGNVKIKRQPAASIFWIGVDEAYRGQGIATRLYEAANALACARGRVLASDATLKEGSRGFWEKQRAKGRATKHQEKVLGKPMNRYALSCPARSLNPARKERAIVSPLPAALFGPGRHILWLAKDAKAEKAFLKALQSQDSAVPLFLDRAAYGASTLDLFMKNKLRKKFLLGGIQFRVLDDKVVISHMVVDAKHRRRGLNSFMVEEIAGEFPDRRILYYAPTKQGAAFMKARGGAESKTNPR